MLTPFLSALAAMGLQAADPAPDPSPVQASGPGAAFEAWAAGDLAAAGEAAQAAMARLEAAGCSVSPDGARLAWILAVGASFETPQGPEEYWFWAAERIARAAGGLTQGQLAAARDLSAQPGEIAAYDGWYAYSPYLGGVLAMDDCGAPRRSLIDPAAGTGDAAYVLLSLRSNRRLRINHADITLAYPPGEGRWLGDSVTGRYLITGGGEGRLERVFHFDPCVELRDQAGGPVEVCRFGQHE